MRYRLITLFFFIGFAFCSEALCQKAHAIEIFATPAIVQFGNPTNRNTEVSDEHIDVNYLILPSQEIGINYLQKSNNKLGWGLGLSWKHDLQKIAIGIRQDPNDWSTTIDHFFFTIEIGNINLKLNLTYALNARVRLDLIFNACSPYPIYSNVPEYFQYGKGSTQWIITPDSTYANSLYSYNVDIKSKGIRARKLIPELRVTSQIHKNIKLNFGTRLKFWESEYSYFKLNVNGHFGSENSQTLHKSAISTKEFGFFFGFTYDLPIRKNK